MSATFEASAIEIELDRRDAAYSPGDPFSASVEVAGYFLTRVSSLEMSVVWYTAGKGDEDLHVHEFVRSPISNKRKKANSTPADDDPAPSSQRFELVTQLPKSPLSYSGRIVKVCWAFRVRLFHDGGRQSLLETPLQLGEVATPAQQEETPATSGGES